MTSLLSRGILRGRSRAKMGDGLTQTNAVKTILAGILLLINSWPAWSQADTEPDLDVLKHQLDVDRLSLEREELESERQKETDKNSLDNRRLWFGIAQWLIAGLFGVIGAYMFRWIPLKNAESRQNAEFQRDLFKGYIDAKDVGDLLLWQRKLGLIEAFVPKSSGPIQAFIANERAVINDLFEKSKVLEKAQDELKKLQSKIREKDEEIESLKRSGTPNEEDVFTLNQEIATLQERRNEEAHKATNAKDSLRAHGLAVGVRKGVGMIAELATLCGIGAKALRTGIDAWKNRLSEEERALLIGAAKEGTFNVIEVNELTYPIIKAGRVAIPGENDDLAMAKYWDALKSLCERGIVEIVDEGAHSAFLRLTGKGLEKARALAEKAE